MTVLLISMTRHFGIESAKAPTKAARATYEIVKNSLSSGSCSAGACMSRSNAMAAISSALSASAEKNCAAIMM